MQTTNNLLDHILQWHEHFPAIDRSDLFAAISVILVLFAIFILLQARRKFSVYLKCLALAVGLGVIFFATFSVKKTSMICGDCGVSYSYSATFFCGILLTRGHVETREAKPEYLLSYPKQNERCYHFYLCQGKMKYWGGVIPTVEYYFGNVIWRLVDDSDLRNAPYPITKDMKIIDVYDESEKITGQKIVDEFLPPLKEYPVIEHETDNGGESQNVDSHENHE